MVNYNVESETGQKEFDIGDLVEVRVTFLNADGDETDPSTVRFRYKKPDSAVVVKTYPADTEIVKVSTGVYYIRLSIDRSGRWAAGGYGSGAVEAAVKTTFSVRASILDE